jgi:hypothetical protein
MLKKYISLLYVDSKKFITNWFFKGFDLGEVLKPMLGNYQCDMVSFSIFGRVFLDAVVFWEYALMTDG